VSSAERHRQIDLANLTRDTVDLHMTQHFLANLEETVLGMDRDTKRTDWKHLSCHKARDGCDFARMSSTLVPE